MADNVFGFAQAKAQHERRALAHEVIAWAGDAAIILADALDVLHQRDTGTATRLRERALERLCYRPLDRASWLAKGAAEVILGIEDGFESLANGIGEYRPESFPLRFARYAIAQAPINERKKREEIAILDRSFEENR